MKRGSLRLLLVEDDLVDRSRVARALRDSNMELVVAPTLVDARQSLSGSHFDCVVLDWNLPEGRAGSLLQELQARDPAVPTVVLTGVVTDEMADHVMYGGAQDFLEKGSYNAQQLQRSVRYAVERHRGTERRRRLTDAERLASIGQLAAGVAHEVNNPATVVLANLAELANQLANATIESTEAAARMAALVQESQTSMLRITRVINQLAGFSQAEQPKVQRLDLRELIRNALTLAEPSVRHRATIELAVPDSAVWMTGDSTALTGVVVGLLLNAQDAIDATPQGSHQILVRLLTDDSGATISVEDSGPGVAPDMRDMIFRTFHGRSGTADNSISLAICREVAQAHGGSLAVAESMLGGAAFRLWLPRDDPDATANAPVDTVPNGLSILIIDDEKALRRVMVRTLQDHRPTAVGSGPQVMALLEAGTQFDVILCDLMMPDPSGDALYRQVVRRWPELASRFVFVTGGAVTPTTRSFLRSVEAPVVAKPFSVDELLDAVAAVYLAHAT